MTLLQIHADLKKTNELLERLVVAAERIAGPPEAEEYVPRVTQPSDIGRTTGGERAAMARLHDLERTLDRRATL